MVGGTPNPYQKYLKTTIETASQPQLLLMLFEAALKKLRIARKAMEEGRTQVSHNELIKVQRIFSELMVALDFEIGGELAQQLFAIYDFVYRQLVQANIRREPKLIDDVMPIVEDLCEGWTKAVRKYEEEQRAVGNSPPEPQTRGKGQFSPPPDGHREGDSTLPVPPQAAQGVATVSPVDGQRSSPAEPVESPQLNDQPDRPRLNLRG